MQRRNMIEVRVKQKTVRTLKRKKIEKRGHRMGECLIDIRMLMAWQ